MQIESVFHPPPLFFAPPGRRNMLEKPTKGDLLLGADYH